jgi:hypothetical protein
MWIYNKDREDRIKFLGYIVPIITDYAENNQIDPVVCYEVCHELELTMIEKSTGKQQRQVSRPQIRHLKKKINWPLRRLSLNYTLNE